MGWYKISDLHNFVFLSLIAFSPNDKVIKLGGMICLLEQSDFENHSTVSRRGR